METQSFKARPSKCLVCHRPAHQHHCGVPTCKGCKTFFRRMYISPKIDKCQFDMKCFNDTGGENFIIRCQSCRFQKCLQVGMNSNDLKISESDSLNASTAKSANLSLLLKQLARFDTHRTHLLKNCSYEGDPSIDEISCMTQNLNFRCGPMAHDQPIIEWSFFTALASYDFLKKLQVVQNLDIRDRSILLRQSFTIISLLSCARDASRNKMSCLKFYNGSDCFLNNALTAPADLENRIRCRLVGRMYDLKVTFEESLLLSVIFICDPAHNGLSERGQSLISSHRNAYSSLLVQYCLSNYQKLGPSRFVDLLSIYDVIKKTHEDLRFHYFLCYLNNPFKIYKVWLP